MRLLFFSGVIGVTGCEPPLDLGPGMTQALLSVEAPPLLVEVVFVLVIAPFVGPLPASFAVPAPVVGLLPASAFGCANAGPERAIANTEISKLARNKDMQNS